MKEFLEYIKENELLSKTLKYLILKNKSNLSPYHNFDHSLNVAKFSFENAVSQHLSEVETNTLIIASLFHDFNHSAGKLIDEINIEIAIRNLRTYYLHNSTLFNLNKLKFSLILDLMLATQYPLIDMKIGKLELIIRDSDMLYSLTPTYFQSIILGLAKEMNVNIITRLNQQIKFINNLKFNTEFANEIWENNKQNLLDELKIYENILN